MMQSKWNQKDCKLMEERICERDEF